MSQYPSMPPPGAYTPANQAPQPPNFNQQQPQQQQPHFGYQQSQAPSPYGASAANHNQPASNKPTKAFGQVFNQAVTQGKPMLDKLGKSITSKLSKQPKQSTPQHLQSYQSYQQHHQQQGQPPVQQHQQYQQGQHGQQQNYPSQGQPFTPGQQSVYHTPQQSPYGQSSYGTTAPATPGQNNYFPQQAPTPSQQQAPQYQQQSGVSSNTNAGNVDHQYHYAGQIPSPPPQGQFNQNQTQGVTSQAPHGHMSGQQTGVIGSSQQQTSGTVQQSSPATSTPQNAFSPSGHQQQPQQWTASGPASHEHTPQAPQSPSSFHPTAQAQQYNAAPPVPVHPSQQQQAHAHQGPQQQQQAHLHQSPQQQQQQPQQAQSYQSPQQQQQQWTAMPPVSPMGQQEQGILPGSSPVPQPSEMQKPSSPAVPFQEQQQPPQPPQQQQPPSATQQPPAQPHTPISQNGPSNPPQTEFIAELPADLGSLSLVEDSRPGQASPTPSQSTPYQPYRPASGQSTASGPGYTIPRRAVSTSSLPLADPWRFADPVTELPTREFYIIADLVFDGIDRRFEPQNTGLLEASKVLESWRAQQLPEEAAELFAHDSYSAFSRIWSLEGVPHMMVPIQPSLMPTWNFQQQIHSQEMKIQEESALATVTYPTYMPALNRAGWYKYFFLNLLHQPEELDKMLQAFCADTYKPSILNQPDVHKRDRNESGALVSRATAISTGAVSRVCQEVVKKMQGTLPQDASRHGGPGTEGPSSDGGVADADVTLKMHSLQVQQQFNNMMNHTMSQGGADFSTGAGNAYKPSYGSLV